MMENRMQNIKMRDKMLFLLGHLESIQYPITEYHQGYYDLLESIVNQYKAILFEIYPDIEKY